MTITLLVWVHKLNFKLKGCVFKSSRSLHQILQQIKVYVADESLIQRSALALREVGSRGHESNQIYSEISCNISRTFINSSSTYVK